jgi:2-hydroxychromene-2-carboxylate isomerase
LRAEYLAHDINRYAKVRGLTIRNIYRAPDSSRFDAGLLWLNRHCPQLVRAYLQTAFEGYWKETLDIQAPGAVLELIRGLGPETADYAVDAARCADELAELRAALVAGGVFNVPSFVVDGQVFVGRAHVPMVRWLLTGRQGPAPV